MKTQLDKSEFQNNLFISKAILDLREIGASRTHSSLILIEECVLFL